MDRRRFISVAGGAGLGILLPYAVYRSLSYGFGGGRVNVKNYEKFGPEAALRARACKTAGREVAAYNRTREPIAGRYGASGV